MPTRKQSRTVKAVVIPAAGPLWWFDLDRDGGLAELQGIVGGFIRPVSLPTFIRGSESATAYVNEEGKFGAACVFNGRATDFMVPGIGLFPGDYIAGPFVLCGFDPGTGLHEALPASVLRRVKLIEREAGVA